MFFKIRCSVVDAVNFRAARLKNFVCESILPTFAPCHENQHTKILRYYSTMIYPIRVALGSTPE
jgi:hypothetical protein